MSRTNRLGLALLMPSQAQKHVTVNEALLRLDALTQLVLKSRAVKTPPAAPAEGDCYAVPLAGAGAWSGRAGQIAVFAGGGWDFVAPRRGWRAFIEDEAGVFVQDAGWLRIEAGAGLPGQTQTTGFRAIALDHRVQAGEVSTTAPAIPAASSVLGITGLVVDPIGGATSFRIGVAGSPDRYGTGIGTGEGSWLRGLTSSPLTYWEETPILLTSETAPFDGSGLLRLLIYAAELPLPT
jgi:hypothetical protein